jgi:hypothetical protein
MKVYQITEARRNPEQNPKVSINQEIDDYVAEENEPAYVSFTKVDKLGINPGSEYNTPLGIYAYPADYVQKETQNGQWMRALPFAGKSEYANLFRARDSDNIVDLVNMPALEARGYYKKLSEIWVKISSSKEVSEAAVIAKAPKKWDTPESKWKTAVDQIEKVINDSTKMALFPEYVGGRFWYITMTVAEMIAEKTGKKQIVIWNKLFRELGIDGCVDEGVGIIHSNEPTQAVFFSTDAIRDVKRVLNKWSPEEVEIGVEKGQKYKQKAQILAKQINQMTPDQIYSAFNTGNFDQHAINLIKIPGGRVQLLKRDPYLVQFINRPTTQEQVVAIRRDDNLLTDIAKRKKLSNAAVEYLLANQPANGVMYALSLAINEGFKLSLNAMLLAVEVNLDLLEATARRRPLPKQVVQLALRKFPTGRIPSWLVVEAHRYGLI